MFEDPNEERRNEQKLQRLKQQKSVIRYTVEFKQIVALTQYDDAACKTMYYKGLKEMVKDEIMRCEWPDDFETMVALAI